MVELGLDHGVRKNRSRSMETGQLLRVAITFKRVINGTARCSVLSEFLIQRN
jgi:hypothetical protein